MKAQWRDQYRFMRLSHSSTGVCTFTALQVKSRPSHQNDIDASSYFHLISQFNTNGPSDFIHHTVCSPSLFLWKRAVEKQKTKTKLNTVCQDCVEIIHPCWSFCVRPKRNAVSLSLVTFRCREFLSFYHYFLSFLFFPPLSPSLTIITAWPVGRTPLACWPTHHPAAPLPVIKRSVMATTVRGWKNVLQLPGSREVRWTLSPGLKRTLKGGGGRTSRGRSVLN